MELVVVLSVLVAVTGIIVMVIPNMIHRANVASCTATISELDKIMQTYEALYSEIPNRMDNLVKADGTLFSRVMTGSDGEYAAASFQAGTLTAAEVAALTEAGLTQVAQPVEDAGGDWNPSFWPYNVSQNTPPTFATVSTTLNYAVVTSTGAKLAGLPYTGTGTDTGNYRYVIFGLNKPCTLFRNLATEPPYHFADTKAEDPATFYMPFAAVYMVKRDFNGTEKVMSKARFMGTIAFHDFGLSTVSMHTREWWNRLKDERPLVGN